MVKMRECCYKITIFYFENMRHGLATEQFGKMQRTRTMGCFESTFPNFLHFPHCNYFLKLKNFKIYKYRKIFGLLVSSKQDLLLKDKSLARGYNG